MFRVTVITKLSDPAHWQFTVASQAADLEPLSLPQRQCCGWPRKPPAPPGRENLNSADYRDRDSGSAAGPGLTRSP